MIEKLEKIGKLYYRIGEGVFGCCINRYKVIGEGFKKINLEMLDEPIQLFPNREAAEERMEEYRKGK